MLLDALSILPGACVAVVGAGGKTSLCWRLAQEWAQARARVIFTTTTHIRQPAPGAFDGLVLGENVEQTPGFFRKPGVCSICAAAGIDGRPDDTPVAESLMPAVHTRLRGISPDQVGRLHAAIAGEAGLMPPISLLVEADGARGLLLKAPAGHEPVIPACADLVCVVACLDAIGRRLDERTVHRPDLVARLAGAAPGAVISAELIAGVLAHPAGGLKGIPGRAGRAAVLTQAGDAGPHPEAAGLAAALVDCGYDVALNVSLRAAQPVLAAVRRLVR